MLFIEIYRFTDMVEQYKRLIFSLCYSFVHNELDAEDLTQETFLSAYRRLEAFDGRNTKAWLMTIAANKCRSFLSDPKRKLTVSQEEELERVSDRSPGPEEKFLQEETRQRLWRCCQRLKEPYRTVAVLYFFQGVRLSAYAEQQGISQRTLETQLYRAKKMLRTLWKEDEDGLS